MQLIAVSLIGIPASGKSTLTKRILNMSKSSLLDASVIVISFDEHIQINFNELSSGDYKNKREILLMKIEDLMEKLKVNRQNDWEEVLSSHELRLSSNSHCLKLSEITLLLLDDNNYFRSMRQKVRAICKNTQCEHFQIFMCSAVKDAKQRNLSRTHPVPESIIEKMHQQIETPVNSRTITINNIHIDDEELLNLLKDRMANPEDIKQTTEKTAQHQSIVHEMDLFTRKELSSRIQSLKGQQNLSETCKILNQKRKDFLDDLRSQDLENVEIESLQRAFHLYLDH